MQKIEKLSKIVVWKSFWTLFYDPDHCARVVASDCLLKKIAKIICAFRIQGSEFDLMSTLQTCKNQKFKKKEKSFSPEIVAG